MPERIAPAIVAVLLIVIPVVYIVFWGVATRQRAAFLEGDTSEASDAFDAQRAIAGDEGALQTFRDNQSSNCCGQLLCCCCSGDICKAELTAQRVKIDASKWKEYFGISSIAFMRENPWSYVYMRWIVCVLCGIIVAYTLLIPRKTPFFCEYACCKHRLLICSAFTLPVHHSG